MNFTGFILTGLNRILGESFTQTLCSIYNAVWCAVCLAGVPLIAGFGIALFFQQPSVTAIKSQPSQLPTIEVNQATPSYLAAPVTLSSTITKVQYSAFLATGSGEVVYRYPAVMVTSHDGKIDAGDLSFRVPPNIKPGTYYLRADVAYPLNAVRTADLKIEMARLVVKE